MRIIDVNAFVNSFKIKPDKSMSFSWNREHLYHPIYHQVGKWYEILKEHLLKYYRG